MNEFADRSGGLPAQKRASLWFQVGGRRLEVGRSDVVLLLEILERDVTRKPDYGEPHYDDAPDRELASRVRDSLAVTTPPFKDVQVSVELASTLAAAVNRVGVLRMPTSDRLRHLRAAAYALAGILTIRIGSGEMVLPYWSRDQLLKQLRTIEAAQAIREAFQREGEIVEIPSAADSLLLVETIETWAKRARELPAGIRSFRNALIADLERQNADA